MGPMKSSADEKLMKPCFGVSVSAKPKHVLRIKLVNKLKFTALLVHILQKSPPTTVFRGFGPLPDVLCSSGSVHPVGRDVLYPTVWRTVGVNRLVLEIIPWHALGIERKQGVYYIVGPLIKLILLFPLSCSCKDSHSFI